MSEHFWTNKVWGIEASSFFELIKKLNEFYKERFVIATQTFQEREIWRAIVYFKEKPYEIEYGLEEIPKKNDKISKRRTEKHASLNR